MNPVPRYRRWAICLFVAGVAVGTGCRDTRTVGSGPDIESMVDSGAETAAGEERSPVARFQPPDGPLPAPTDYWRADDGESLAPPADGSSNAAERVYREYLAGLDAYPFTVGVRFPIDGELDPATLEGGIVTVDRSDWTIIDTQAEWRAGAGEVRLSSSDSDFEPGRRYAVALAGGPDGIAGPGGRPLVADRAFPIVRGDRDPAAGSPWSDEVVERLGELSDSYDPVFEFFADERGLSRERVAAMTQFRTSRRTAVWFDPESGRMPIPNDYLYNRSDERVDLPERDGASEQTAAIRGALSEYDGFSTSAPMFAETTDAVDASTFGKGDAFRLFRNTDSGWRAVEGYRTGVFEGRETIWAEPTPALEPDARYAYVVTDALEDPSGSPVRAQPAAALLRGDASLVDDRGHSRLAFFADGPASRLEWLRNRVGDLTRRLDSDGLGRSSIAAVVPFRTMDVLDEHLQRRARLYEKPVPTDVLDTEAKSPLERGQIVAMPRVETVVTGRMTTLDYLDPSTRAFRRDGTAREREIAFALTIPKGVDRGDEVPVVMFGHGLTTSRELLYLIADRLAAAGFAAIAIDLPYHGERSVCEADRHCRGAASCDARGRCREPDGGAGELRRIEAPAWLWEESPTYPVTSGRSFIDLDDLVATRDHFAQAMVDLMQTLRVVRGADWSEATGGYHLDGDDVVYLGMSLGGILGANLSAVEPTLDDFALNVPGGDFVAMISNSSAFEVQYRRELEERGLEPRGDRFRRFVHRAHWLLDPVDPMNLARYATARTVRYREPGTDRRITSEPARVLIQMAEGDSVMPNRSTEILAARMEADVSRYSPAVSDHGFVFSPGSIDGKEARDEIVAFFERR